MGNYFYKNQDDTKINTQRNFSDSLSDISLSSEYSDEVFIEDKKTNIVLDYIRNLFSNLEHINKKSKVTKSRKVSSLSSLENDQNIEYNDVFY